MSGKGTPRGFFITFEGPEGSGKSTQIERLAAALRRDGYTVCTTREPGGTPLGEAIRAIVLDPKTTAMTPWTEALLFTAARAQLVREVLRPHLVEGEVVISDRYADSTIAYQGFGRQLDRDALRRLQALATDGLTPDLTILLSLPVERGLDRIARAERDRLDDETVRFHAAVHEGYLALAREEPQRWVQIDASQSPDAVAQAVHRAAAQALAGVHARRSA